jgi:hypothetical protein
MTVILDRDGGDLNRTRRLGLARSSRPCVGRSAVAAGRRPFYASCVRCSLPWPIQPV